MIEIERRQHAENRISHFWKISPKRLLWDDERPNASTSGQSAQRRKPTSRRVGDGFLDKIFPRRSAEFLVQRQVTLLSWLSMTPQGVQSAGILCESNAVLHAGKDDERVYRLQSLT
jgi:hypothetical protein